MFGVLNLRNNLMNPDLEEIFKYQPGWGSFTKIGRAIDGSRQVQRFSHASALGYLSARAKYLETFGKLVPQQVDQYHPVIIAKLCRYACRVGIDLETLLTKTEPSHEN